MPAASNTGRVAAMEEYSENDRIAPREQPVPQQQKRVLHFSDGTIEYDSDSDASDVLDGAVAPQVEEKNLTLSRRLRRRMHGLGSSMLTGIDIVGSELALFLGMGDPNADRKRKSARRGGGSRSSSESRAWTADTLKNNNHMTPLTVQPSSSNNNALIEMTPALKEDEQGKTAKNEPVLVHDELTEVLTESARK